MSSVTTLSKPAALPAQIPPISPATGPDIRRFTGRSVAASTVAVPPEDCIIRSRAGIPPPAKPGRIWHVSRHLGADVRIQAHGREALELAVERQHLVGDRQERVRQLLEQDLLDALLVGRIDVRVKEADGDGLHAGIAQLQYSLAHLVLVEGHEHIPSGHRDALLHRQPVAALHERP